MVVFSLFLPYNIHSQAILFLIVLNAFNTMVKSRAFELDRLGFNHSYSTYYHVSLGKLLHFKLFASIFSSDK